MRNLKSIFLAVAMLMATVFTAQAQTDYQPDWKYSFFSNWTISTSVVGTKTPDFSNMTLGEGTNIGADIRMSKRIGKCWYMRYMAEVPGFVNIDTKNENHFDRYGKALSGIEFHPVNWLYMFADAGAGYNPDNVNKLGIATDAGIGLLFNTGRCTGVYLETGADRCQNIFTKNLNEWHSNFFAKLGFAVRLGITKNDRMGIENRNSQNEHTAMLENENQDLRNANQELSDSNAEISKSLENLIEEYNKLEEDLNDCLNRKVEVENTNVEPIQVYFEYNSYKISALELEKLSIIYSKMDPSKQYTVNGYCSDNGDDQKNQVLSEKRACAVKDALVKLGADAGNLNTVGHGKSKGCDNPICQMVEITW